MMSEYSKVSSEYSIYIISYWQGSLHHRGRLPLVCGTGASLAWSYRKTPFTVIQVGQTIKTGRRRQCNDR